MEGHPGINPVNISSKDGNHPHNTRHLWRQLREDFRRVVAMMKKEDAKPLVLNHGLEPMRHLSFLTKLRCVKHVSEQQCLFSLDCDGNVHLHHEDGRILSHTQLPWPISGLLYADGVDHYVAWSQKELLLLDKTFALVSQSSVKDNVFCCVYYPGRKLVLSGGDGGVSVWNFGLSRRSLVLQQSLGVKPQDKVTIIAIDAESHTGCTCLAVCGTSVWEFDLTDGSLRRVRKNLHLRTITSLVYSEILRLLITGSRDQTIKVWAGEGHLIAVFVGHTGPITALSLSTSSLILISGSEDETVRMWDLNTQEQVEEQKISGSVIGVEAFGHSETYVLSYSSFGVYMWQRQHLYQLHCLLGTSVAEVRASGRHLPARALCVGTEGAIRLISADSGDVISTLLVGRDQSLLGADYCIYKETVCVLLEDGKLLKANALDNPMSVLSTMEPNNEQALPRCFTLYSYIVDVEVAVAEWKQVLVRKGDRGQHGKEMKNKFFILTGTEAGTLCVYDWSSCQILFQTEAHSPGQVTCLTSDPKNNYIISAGSDSMVKVWRFFPYSAGSLSLHMSFSCSHPVGRMCSFKSQLFVAFHDTQSAAYSLVQYCLRTGNRKEHPPTDDHQDQITGLCSCAALRLVATSGRDGKIRLWDEDNRLIRTLCLNSTPDCLAFTGDRGDLLVAIHSHLYRINLFKHLPRSYQVKIMCMKPPSVTRDPPITIPSDYLMSLSEDDRRRLSQPQSLLHGYFAESLHAEHDGKNGEQEQGYSLLSARDQDLNLILQGKIRPRKKPKRSKDTRREAMERYLQLFYRQRPRIVISEEDDINGEELCPDTPREDPFIPPNSNKGFFTDSALGFSIHSLPRHLQSPFLSVGTIPNSAILQLLWPVECQSKTEELHPAKKYEHLMFKNISIGEEEKKENEDTEEKVEEYTEDVEEDNDIPAILQKITASIEEQKISPSSSDTGLVPPPSPPPPPAGQEQGEKKASLPDKSILSRIPRPRPQQTKRSYPPVISEKPTLQDPPIPAVPKMSPVPAPPSPDSDREEHEETPPIVQETPVFILQFQDCSWFSSIFTDAQMEPSEFESRLLFGVVHSELLMRIQLLHALRSLYQQGYLKDLKGTFRTIVDVVESFVGTSLKAKEKLDFLWLCLRFLIELSGSNRQLVLALLMSCVLVHPSHRERFLSLFRDIGVEDPHGFIGRQVSAWDTWEHTENIRTLKRTCEDWLESWTVLLTDFLRSAMSQDPQKSHRDRGKAPPTSQSQGHIRSSQRQVDSLAIDVAPSDVLNYFCEVQLRKEIQQMRGAAPGDGSTVLALPPIHRKRALLRLGESRMYVKPRDQKDVFLPQIPQKLLPNIIPFINLPLKKVSLCPFATTSERPGAPHLTGSLKQDVHRYFILQQSYLESYY
ncbi:WD repeat-containing protein 97 isoform X2 [Hyperolius riggenbachi]|uniref:WD repeat-containing protein 97 isoform X2 n=1 Tax=Hyperolius riggenbachi TaxID=752182 RepID=UPI0035A30731